MAKRIYYKEPVFRPPSEARSLLIQATEGCTHRCTFCVSNYGKKYIVRPIEEIKGDIDTAREIYGQDVRRLFFLDGNALSMPFNQLREITRHAMNVFPGLERVGVYACGEDILDKKSSELESLRDAGLGIVYVGLETGDDQILQEINKKITREELVAAALKVMAAGITFSGTIILGIAGTDMEKSRRHAVHTAEMINAMTPPKPMTWYIGALTLMIPPHTVVKKKVEQGSFTPMNNLQILEETKVLLEHIDDEVHDCVFRSNHASNYLVLKGTLSQDRQKLLDQVERALDQPSRYLRSEYLRGL